MIEPKLKGTNMSNQVGAFTELPNHSSTNVKQEYDDDSSESGYNDYVNGGNQ